jgi:hypothetical protein
MIWRKTCMLAVGIQLFANGDGREMTMLPAIKNMHGVVESCVKFTPQPSQATQSRCGMFYEGWHTEKVPVKNVPVKNRCKEAFLGHVLKNSPNDLSVDREHLTGWVFALPPEHVSSGAVDVRPVTPESFHHFFPRR